MDSLTIKKMMIMIQIVYLYHLVMTNSLLLNMAIEIVDLHIDSMVMFHSSASLPEGIIMI